MRDLATKIKPVSSDVGQPLANGVYLARVTVMKADGMVDCELTWMMVMR